MKKLFSNGLIALAGFVSLPGPVTTVPPPSPIAKQQSDPRLGMLREFFDEIHSPAKAKALAVTFISVADQYQLDWRLLPSISVVESEAGKTARNNNMFGWDCGRAAFPTLSAGIKTVAYYLANSALYKDKDLDTLLETYNPNREYPARVKSVMQRIAPSELPAE